MIQLYWYNDANQTPSKCTDSNADLVDFNATVASGGFLPGTTCQNECPEGYGLSMGDGWPVSTCMCDYYGNGGYGCMFDLTHVSYCVPAVCSADLKIMWRGSITIMTVICIMKSDPKNHFK